jgi:hypothetical protein
MFSIKKIPAFFKTRFFGLLSVVFLSILFLVIFYGKVLFSLNTTFFSTSGDGILSYYNSYYLAKFDTSLMFSRSINYPYGEVAFYTQSQPFIAGTLKFISENIVDVTVYTVGVINFLMLFSIVMAAIILYLLLTEMGLPSLYGLFVSVGIAFLSPQIDRFPGHFSLSYVFAIPLLLYLLLLFHKRQRKILISSITGAVLFVLMTCHVYFVAFFGIAIAFYWISAFINPRDHGSIPPVKAFLCIALQLIIPVLIFYLITSHYSYLSPDRPSKPYGFLVYKASPESVLLPLWVDYGKIIHRFWKLGYVQWEGVSYVGITAAVGFFVLLAGLLKKILKRNWKALFQVTDNYFLNIMFWASFAALLYSFGYPFIFGLEALLEFLGPLQQMRAIGRFAWLFYFVMNIVAFYRIWSWRQTSRKKALKNTILILCMILLYTDVYYFLKSRQGYLNNKFPAWSDSRNAEHDNQWVAHIDAKKYQAILPLPFYHMGSDNYSINARCNMLANSFLVSMKTGLPVAAIYISRASISQSIKNIALVLEPYRDLKILKDFPNKKPFLIVAARCNEFTPEEKNLLHLSFKIDSNTFFNLYRLDYDSLLMIPRRKSKEIIREFADRPDQIQDSIYKSDNVAVVEHLNFDASSQAEGYQGKALQITGRSSVLLFDNYIPSGIDSIHLLSFWLCPVDKDLVPKTRLEIALFNDKGIQYDYRNEMMGSFLKTVDNSWGLVEYPIRLLKPGSRVRITAYNTEVNRKQLYLIDELLIRPHECNVYYSHRNFISKNNRWFYSTYIPNPR